MRDKPSTVGRTRAGPGPAGQDDRKMVTLRSISKAYGSRDNRVAALTDVTTDFPAGTFTAIIGASGSGKSTLLQCAAGLDRVDSGEVVIAGTTLSSLNENALTRMRR